MLVLDDLDQRLLTNLRRNSRASYAQLAADLGVTRATVRARITRLELDGEITGYTVQLRSDFAEAPIRALVMLGIEGRGTKKIVDLLMGLPAVQAVHSTNGNWDLVVETNNDTLIELDQILARIRLMDGVTRSETSILLSTRRM